MDGPEVNTWGDNSKVLSMSAPLTLNECFQVCVLDTPCVMLAFNPNVFRCITYSIDTKVAVAVYSSYTKTCTGKI